MRRFYTKEDYLTIVEKLKKRIPNILITTDLIIGFPGETDEDNDHTIDLIKQVEFATAFTYIYSKREGTPAAAIEEQVPEHIAKERFNKVLDALKPISLKINRQQIGTTQTALVESVSKNDPNLLSGRLENSLLIHFKGEESQIGTLVDVKVTDCKTFYLIGEQC
jgi:tRNA-2-methylthio-N6-dimethylallyladenosine synthase